MNNSYFKQTKFQYFSSCKDTTGYWNTALNLYSKKKRLQEVHHWKWEVFLSLLSLSLLTTINPYLKNTFKTLLSWSITRYYWTILPAFYKVLHMHVSTIFLCLFGFFSVRFMVELKLKLNTDNSFLTLTENFDPSGCWTVLTLGFKSEGPSIYRAFFPSLGSKGVECGHSLGWWPKHSGKGT